MSTSQITHIAAWRRPLITAAAIASLIGAAGCSTSGVQAGSPTSHAAKQPATVTTTQDNLLSAMHGGDVRGSGV